MKADLVPFKPQALIVSVGAVPAADAVHQGCGDSETLPELMAGYGITSGDMVRRDAPKSAPQTRSAPNTARMRPTTAAQEASRLVFVSVKDAKPRRYILYHPSPTPKATPTHLVRIVGPAHSARSRELP